MNILQQSIAKELIEEFAYKTQSTTAPYPHYEIIISASV